MDRMDIGSKCTVELVSPASSAAGGSIWDDHCGCVALGECYVGLIKSCTFRVSNTSAEAWVDVTVRAGGSAGSAQISLILDNNMLDETVAAKAGAKDLLACICGNEATASSSHSPDGNASDPFSRRGAAILLGAAQKLWPEVLRTKTNHILALQSRVTSSTSSRSVWRGAALYGVRSCNNSSSEGGECGYSAAPDADGDTRPFMAISSEASKARSKARASSLAWGANGSQDPFLQSGDWEFQIAPNSVVEIQILVLPLEPTHEKISFETKWSASAVSPNLVAFRRSVATAACSPHSSLRTSSTRRRNKDTCDNANARTMSIVGDVLHSSIQVLPLDIDLGDCNIGEYRSGAVTIRNNSNIDTIVVPVVDSATITFARRFVRIRAAASVTVPFDFVAHDVDSNYCKQIAFVNLKNAADVASVQIRANNVDAHHILLHNMFYKIYTYVSTKQLLVQYNTCVFARPNVKFISVRNMYSHPIQLKVYSKDAASLCVMHCPGISLSADGCIIGGYAPITSDTATSNCSSLATNAELLEYINVATSEPSFPFSFLSSILESSGAAEAKSSLDAAQVPSAGRARTASGDTTLPPPQSRSLRSSSHKNSIDTGIKFIDKCLAAIDKVVTDCGGKSDVDSVTAREASECVLNLAVGAVTHVLIVLKPQPTNSAEELEAVDVLKELNIELMGITTEDIRKHILSSSSRASSDSLIGQLSMSSETLSVRKVPIHAVATRSEFEILQKNINFGKVLVGSVSLRSVTLVNVSSVPLLYAIVKTGSIASGFLEITSGEYRGVVGAKASVTIQFKFRPVLSGNFEETLIVRNVLNESNSKTIVVKSSVVKPDNFVILSVEADAADLPKASDSSSRGGSALPAGTYSEEEAGAGAGVDGRQKLIALAVPILDKMLSLKSVTRQSAISPVNIGELCVGELYRDKLSFRIKNVSGKVRHYIIDAAHSQALMMLSPHLVEDSAARQERDRTESFETSFLSQNICSLACDFSLFAPGASKKSMEEREALKDKLEGFRQKLKIAIRKNKAEKIAKLEKKIRDINDSLNDATSGEQLKTPSEQSDQAVVRDTATLHFQLQAGEEVVVSVGITVLPSFEYKPWVGDPLPLLGSLRVSESRNDDVVKSILFGVLVHSHESYVSVNVPESKKVGGDLGAEDIILPKGRTRDVGIAAVQVYAGNNATPTSSAAGSKELMSRRLLLATVSPWCAYYTKNLLPSYRKLSRNILGVSIKLTPFEGINGTSGPSTSMYGVLSVTSTVNESALLEVNFDYDCSSYIPGVKYCDLASSAHGVLQLAFLSADDLSNHSRAPLMPPNMHLSNRIDKIIAPGESINILVVWNPLSQDVFDKFFLAMLILRMNFNRSREDSLVEEPSHHLKGTLTESEALITSLYVPTICLVERNSVMKVDKYINLGDVALGKFKDVSISVNNVHKANALHYKATVLSLGAQALSGGFGVVRITGGSTGVVEHNSSRNVQVSFLPTRVGKFEQEILVTNMGDSFDQKRVVVSANVSIPQSRYIVLPDIQEIESKNILNLGLVQLPSANASTDCVAKHSIKPFRIVNVSGKKLFVSADSNIRNQCGIFEDFECQIPLSFLPLIPSITTTVYIRLRRPGKEGAARFYRSSAPVESASVVGRDSLVEDDNEGAAARNLSGGIRFSFFESSEAELSFGQEPECILETGRYKRFLDIPVLLMAKVGSSLINVTSKRHTYRCIPTGSQGANRFLRGFFRVVNLSPDFEANYSFSKKQYCESSASIQRDNNYPRSIKLDSYEFRIAAEPTGHLAPLECRDIEFYVSYSSLKGLLTKNVELLNTDTGRRVSVSLSFFFDSRKLICTMPSSPLPRSARDRSSHDTTASDLLSHIRAEAAGIRYSQNMISSDIETVECTNSIWIDKINNLSAFGQADSMLTQNTNRHQHNAAVVVTGCASRKTNCIGYFAVYNSSSVAVTVSPVSNLPVRLVSIKKSGSCDLDNHENDCPISKTLTMVPGTFAQNSLSTSRIRSKTGDNSASSQRNATSVVDLPGGLLKSGLVKCGEAITLEAGESCIVHICCDMGAQVADYPEDQDLGVTVRREGFVALVASAQALTGLFRDPGEGGGDRLESSATIPVLCFIRLQVAYVAPTVRVLSKSITLDGLKSGGKALFDVLVENISDSECPFSVKGLPTFLCINRVCKMSDNRLGGSAGLDLDVLEQVSPGVHILPARYRAVVHVTIDCVPDAPRTYLPTCMRYSFDVCNMSRAFSQFKYERFPVEVSVNILPSQALQLLGMNKISTRKPSLSSDRGPIALPTCTHYISLGGASVYRAPSACSEDSHWMVAACSKKSTSFQIRNVLSVPIRIDVSIATAPYLENFLEIRLLISGGFVDARIITLSPGEIAEVIFSYSFECGIVDMSSMRVLQLPGLGHSIGKGDSSGKAEAVTAALPSPRGAPVQDAGDGGSESGYSDTDSSSSEDVDEDDECSEEEDASSDAGSGVDGGQVAEKVLRLVDATGCERSFVHFGCRQVGALRLSPCEDRRDSSSSSSSEGGTGATEPSRGDANRFDDLCVALGVEFSFPMINVG